jgi:hypothetical protein
LIGGLSIADLLVVGIFDYDGETKPVLTSTLIVSLLVNCPHFSPTVYRLYQSLEHTRQFPGVAVLVGSSRCEIKLH